MPAPRNYVRGYSFAGYQATNPNRPLPGTSLDNELEEIEQSLTEAISALSDIRRADGQLRNGIVGLDALAPDLATGVRPATLWQAGIQYQAQDTVSYLASFYRCTIAHLSTDFLTDLTATRWELYADIGTTATDAQIARNEAVAARNEAVPAGAAATAGSNNVTALYDLFDDRYLGEKTALPTLDNDGNALVNGALVSLTGQAPSTLNGMYVRRGGAWQSVLSQFLGAFVPYRYVATASQTVFSGADANGATLGYVANAVLVTVNGVSLSPNTYTATNGTSVVLGTALTAGDVVVIYSFGSFSVADTWTKAEADARFVLTTGYQDPNLFDAYLPGGIAAPVTFAAVTKGEIKLKEQYNITTGSGISGTERARNKTRMFYAFQEASEQRRPVKFPRGEIVEMDCSTGGILVNLDNVEIDLNQATLRHAGTENSTMFQVQKTAAQINNFKIYNGTLDGNAQGGKTGQYYILAGLFHSGTYLEDLTFLDPFGCGLHFSDPYASPGRPYPAMISSNMIVRNCRTVRSTANRNYMVTYPAMFQSDQAVITHVRNLLIDGYYAEISGMSGISVGLSENVTFRRGTFDSCGASVYCETLTGFVVDDISVVNHQHWQGSSANNFNTSAVWLTDGDLSTPSGGFGSCRDGIVSNIRIQSISRTNTGGDFKGVYLSGRDGASRGAQNITISNVTARGMSGGQTGASAVTIEGQITAASISNVVADNCSIALRANSSYTTFGGAAANLMTGVGIDNVTARACGYSFYAPGTDPTHVSTFIRNSAGNGASYSIVNSIGVQGFVP